LLRDIIGNPWRLVPFQALSGRIYPRDAVFPLDDADMGPVVRPVEWLTPLVLGLARAAYDERPDDGTLDPDRLAILADVLEEAGCTEETILRHLRGPGPHICGCWALDLLLSKG
jgi:hypothetical protein